MQETTSPTKWSPLSKQHDGPWCANPWINSLGLGPRSYRDVEHGSPARALAQLGAAMKWMNIARAKRTLNDEQQRSALNAWEDEGGDGGGSRRHPVA